MHLGQHKKSGCINTILSSLRFFLLTSFDCLHSLSSFPTQLFIPSFLICELTSSRGILVLFLFLFVLLSFEGILAFSLSVSINTQTIPFPCWYGPKSDHRRISFHPIFQLLLSPTFVSFLFPFIGLFFRTCHPIIPSICSIFTCWTSIITPTFQRYQEVPSFNCAKMAESLINSPNSAEGNALGRSGFHNMDNLFWMSWLFPLIILPMALEQALPMRLQSRIHFNWTSSRHPFPNITTSLTTAGRTS